MWLGPCEGGLGNRCHCKHTRQVIPCSWKRGVWLAHNSVESFMRWTSRMCRTILFMLSNGLGERIGHQLQQLTPRPRATDDVICSLTFPQHQGSAGSSSSDKRANLPLQTNIHVTVTATSCDMLHTPSLERWEGPGPHTWLYSSTGPGCTSEHPTHWQGHACFPPTPGRGRGVAGEGLAWPVVW